MICEHCHKELTEKEIEESHDVCRWMFLGTPNKRKAQADKFRRRWLCKECHDAYDLWIRKTIQDLTSNLADIYFEDIKNGDR